ncbi:hypothetical protein CULT_580005 [[Clostridium] ultunense Esp]|nr:hypothetical protein CULT_580005 [[Clostridium] ultunense Esp]
MTELLFQFFTLFSTWNLIRTLGITAYVLFFLALLAGTIYRMELKLGKWAGLFLFVHQNAGWLAFFSRSPMPFFSCSIPISRLP